ncbi:gamma-glutamyl-gamma-aminobutyrate hydrolase family protein [Nitrospira moscoviensis]|uniref:gamma-glutamyl-gamma-aminobutyrate hydrolase n=1 Tax=Nitrospira moscoviensis TaxID=42253 RepID=A0A0K2G6R9_NITMO|nr:gamma-glutamyl-gamma-aminobutyrate hydrolase family protein [Nitrospira moscoviensis]ALA56625.1 putative Gamma-glutamyl-gamma-aminobutyrate hydrolase [Nitrospira moscoviensis]
MKPVIGVTPDFNAGERTDMGGSEPTYFLRARYIRAIEELGGIPLILPLVAGRAARRRLLDGVDGLLLTGSGPDLPPRLYGERQRYPFPLVSERRADFELDLVHQANARDLPLLGICGGMQTVNVACGGSLFQDIPSQVRDALQHRQKTTAVHVAHSVKVAPNSLLRKIVNQATLKVNSSHHQSVKTVAPSLVASAVAPDGIVEAIESPAHRFLLAVQWHPEFLFERHQAHRRLFEALLRAARRTGA